MVQSLFALSWISVMVKLFLTCLRSSPRPHFFAKALSEDQSSVGVSMNRPSQAEKKIRTAGCNALVSALVFLREPENQNIGRCILVVAESMDALHSKQNAELRSAHGTLK